MGVQSIASASLSFSGGGTWGRRDGCPKTGLGFVSTGFAERVSAARRSWSGAAFTSGDVCGGSEACCEEERLWLWVSMRRIAGGCWSRRVVADAMRT